MSFTDHFTTLSFPNLGLVRFPETTISAEDRAALGVKPDASNRTVLKRAAWNGYLDLKARGQFDGIPEADVIARFKVEFDVFTQCGVDDYLLLVWNINRWCDKQGIVRGYGRGSAGGSLTLYCLNVTKGANPLRHHLDFRRFLSEARMKPVIKDGVLYVDGKSAPDIDCDYQYLRREDVVQYIASRYPGRTAKISTRLDLTGKMALKNVLKTYAGYHDEEAQRVSDLIDVKYGKVQSLGDARDQNQLIKDWIAASDANREVYDIALALEGSPVARGQHPSGVAISYEPLDGTIPLEIAKDGGITTTYDMETVAGLLTKLDVLGLRTLDLVAGTAALAGIKVDDIDIHDPFIYESLPTHDRYLGLFQIADGLTKQAARKIKPRNLDELATVLAISRPGALAFIDQFAEYVKSGTIKPFYPSIDEVLKSTGGALIFQEQITAVCHDVFGLSPVDADSVRYATGKKRRDLMEPWEKVLREKGQERAIPEAVIAQFWSTCSASADYSFNASHGLLYSCLTAATIYLKAKHPLAFYLTMLKLAREEPNPTEYMNSIISEGKSAGISILPPDIVKSEPDFTIQDGSIRFGLQSIKGVSDTTMAKLSSFRRDFATRFELFEAAQAAKVPINVLTSLIYSGCLDTKGVARSYFALQAQLYNLLTDREKPLVHKLAPQYDEDLLAILKAMPMLKDEKGRALIKESRLETLRRDYEPWWRVYQHNARNEELTSYLQERMLLGFSHSGNLHALYSKLVVGLTPLSDVVKRSEVAAATLPKGKQPPVKVVAFVEEAKLHRSKANGTPYLKLRLASDDGSFPAMLHSEERLDGCRSFNGRLPDDQDLVIATGSFSRDRRLLFLDSAIIQPNPVLTKPGPGRPKEETPS